MQTDILEVLLNEIARAAKVSEVTAETSIVRDLGLDSLAVMNFIMALEDRFDMLIPIDRVADVDTVGELAATIETLKSEQHSS